LPILAQHPDLVATLAAEYDVPIAVLQGLLKRESAFGLTDEDGCTVDPRSAEEDRNELPTTVGVGPALRLSSLTTENLYPSNSIACEAATSRDGRLKASLSQWSLSEKIRLLFLGTDDVGVRSVGFPPQRLSRHEYVVGKEGIWHGLLQPGSARGAATVHIRAEFDRDGIGFAVERRWRFEGVEWIEEFHVHENGRRLAGREAGTWLNGFMPLRLIPLFAYDASDVLALMLSPLRRREALDRLYPSAFLADLVSSVRKEGMPAQRNVGIRRLKEHLSFEVTVSRRRWKHAVRMLSEAGDRIRPLESELAAAGKELDCLKELSGMPHLQQPPVRRRGKQQIAIPEPLSLSDPGTVGMSGAFQHDWNPRNGMSDRLAARSTELVADIDELRGRIEAARDDKNRWTEAVEVCSWRLRAYVAEEAIVAASSPAEVEEGDGLVRCLEDLTRRLRQRSRDAVRAALRSHCTLLDPSMGCLGGLELDDEGGLGVGSGRRPSDGPEAFIEERAAFLLMLAMQEASGCPMPVFATLDPRQVHERNLAWLEACYVPLVSRGTIILAGSECPDWLEEEGRMSIRFSDSAGVGI
jgi:hypothetical protein